MGKFSRIGNDLYTGKKSIDFVGRKWLWYAGSVLILLICFAGLYFKGLNWGIEFTGGAEFRVALPASEVTQETADQLRDDVAATGIDAASSPVVTTTGQEGILIQTEPLTRARAVVARAQQKGCTLLITEGDWHGASIRLTARVCGYETTTDTPGFGRISKVRLDVSAEGRAIRRSRTG